MSEVDETSLSDEWTKFGVLVIVMIVIVLVVAMSRTLIFTHIVPVVLGDGLDSVVQPVDLAPPIPEDPVVEEPTESSPDSLESGEEVAIPLDEGTPTETEAIEAVPTLVTARTHVVKTGETLTVISNQYDVPVTSIVNANNLASADRINVGDQLTIPQE